MERKEASKLEKRLKWGGTALTTASAVGYIAKHNFHDNYGWLGRLVGKATSFWRDNHEWAYINADRFSYEAYENGMLAGAVALGTGLVISGIRKIRNSFIPPKST